MESMKILVIGDLMLDKYIWGAANKLSPEAPVPVVLIQSETYSLGGACNVAHNLVALGASVSLYGAIGEDREGEILRDLLGQKGIDTHCYKSSRPTTTKIRVMAIKHQMLRIDRENTESLEEEIYFQMLDSIKRTISEFKCVILSDYLKGVLNVSFTQELISLANKYTIPVLCDPKGSDYTKYRHATIITPNKSEAVIATGIEIKDDASLLQALRKLGEICALTYPLITLSEEGIGYLDCFDDSNKIDSRGLDSIRLESKDSSGSMVSSIDFSNAILHKKPTKAKEVYDVSGAGDTVIAALAFQLALGSDIDSAISFANVAAAIVISKIGSAVVSMEEIAEIGGAEFKVQNKITSNFECIKDSINKQRESGKKIIFTNGCFDILHFGHVKYLEEAKSLGDASKNILIVGLNSDDSVRRLKGQSRPINSQADRAFILAGLESVDFVVIFNEDTPQNLIKQLRPDILVKGADYKDKPIIGSQYAKEVRLIEYVQDKSTSGVISKILGR